MMSRHPTAKKKASVLVPALLLLCAFVLLASCDRAQTPEEQIRQYVEHGRAALEGKDTGEIGDMISARYSDAAGNDRREVLRLLSGFFLRRQAIHLASSIEEITVAADGSSAALVVYAALARAPIEKDDLNLLDATFYRLRGQLVLDGDWQLVSTELQRVSADAFLNSRD